MEETQKNTKMASDAAAGEVVKQRARVVADCMEFPRHLCGGTPCVVGGDDFSRDENTKIVKGFFAPPAQEEEANA